MHPTPNYSRRHFDPRNSILSHGPDDTHENRNEKRPDRCMPVIATSMFDRAAFETRATGLSSRTSSTASAGAKLPRSASPRPAAACGTRDPNHTRSPAQGQPLRATEKAGRSLASGLVFRGASDRIRTCNPQFTKLLRYRCATLANAPCASRPSTRRPRRSRIVIESEKRASVLYDIPGDS